jgi:GT2 family glycosyltransferase
MAIQHSPFQLRGIEKQQVLYATATIICSMNRTIPKVGIVVLNWNNYEDTAECIRSLENINYENYFIVVVDNGSTDGSVEKLSEEFDHNFVINSENKGFSGGCNAGIKHALAKGADYTLLINNDIIVEDDFLGPLVSTAENHKRVAAVGGVIYEYGSGKIWDAGGKMLPIRGSVIRHNEIQSSEEYETEFVTCALSLLSREFLSDNTLDEEYFFGVEEIDLSWRAIQQGWKLYTNPSCTVQHKVGNSTDKETSGGDLLSNFQYYHKTRGHLYFASKNFDFTNSLKFYLANLFIFSFYYTVLRLSQGRPDVLYTYLIAIIDYFTDKEPKKPIYFR